MNTFAIEARGICKGFDGVKVLDGVDFRLSKGEAHAIVGANGAGKSTFMKILNGIYSADSGSVSVFGEKAGYDTPEGARKAGIAMVYQDLSLVPTLSVAENIFLASNPYKKGPFIDDGRARTEAAALLKSLGVGEAIDPDARVADISVGQQQLVEIAKALAGDPRILILDEPTASLSSSEIETLFDVIARLKSRGMSIIYITHYLRDIFKICESVTALRDGKAVLSTLASATTVEALVAAMIGIDEESRAEWKLTRRGGARKPLLEIRGLTTDSIRDVSIEIAPGEVVGLAGLLGSGRTELLRALYGCDRIVAGSVYIDGTEVEPRSPSDALAAGIALVPEDRRRQGLILDFSVEQNVVLPVLEKIRGRFLIDERKSGGLADRYIERLGMKVTGRDQRVRYLSGGNQQKVVVAKCLSSEAKILLLDDPTFGVDMHSKMEIMRIVRDFASDGGGVLFVSSEFKEVAEFCDAIYVMKKGRVTCIVQDPVTEEQLMQLVQ
jgi:ribose transport system ATP-binding protein